MDALLLLIVLVGLFFIPGFFAALLYWIVKLAAMLFKLAFVFWQVTLFLVILGLLASIF